MREFCCISGPSVGYISFSLLWLLGIVAASCGETGNADSTAAAAGLKLVVTAGDTLSCKAEVPGDPDAVEYSWNSAYLVELFRVFILAQTCNYETH
jgi:hypothetical protein